MHLLASGEKTKANGPAGSLRDAKLQGPMARCDWAAEPWKRAGCAGNLEL